MGFCHVFGIGARRILAKNCCVEARVTSVRSSVLYVVKKPIRLYPNEKNTAYSRFITFTYRVGETDYPGKLFITPFYRCPAEGETICVYYDPQKPEDYACYAFGPRILPNGW